MTGRSLFADARASCLDEIWIRCSPDFACHRFFLCQSTAENNVMQFERDVCKAFQKAAFDFASLRMTNY
jgi:hypothetical protein